MKRRDDGAGIRKKGGEGRNGRVGGRGTMDYGVGQLERGEDQKLVWSTSPTRPLRTLMQGDKKAGFTIFWADDGLDTGPILLQKECEVQMDDTVDTLYGRFLYPEGIRAMVQ